MNDDQKYQNAISLARSGDFDRAGSLFAGLVKAYPENAELSTAYVRCLGLSFRYDEAKAEITRLLRVYPGNTALLIEIATISEDWQQPRLALDYWEAAARNNDAPPGTWVEIARVLEYLNRPEDARGALERTDVRSAARLLVEARLSLREADFGSAERSYREITRRASDPAMRQRAWLALAGISERNGDFSRAWQCIGEGKSQLREDALSMRASSPLPSFGRDAISARVKIDPVEPDWSPLFLLGFPRSGTSLTGKWISEASGAFYADETLAGANAMRCLTDPGNPDSWTSPSIRSTREHYQASMLRICGSAALPQVIEKNPALSLWAPLFREIFPEARMVWCTRDPRDVLVSCLTTDFPLNPFTSHFNEPDHIADLILSESETRKWMSEDEPGLMIASNYEEAVARGGLDPAVVDFVTQGSAARKGVVDNFHTVTPSYFEVTRPPNGQSIGRWKGYEPWLGEVFDRIMG